MMPVLLRRLVVRVVMFAGVVVAVLILSRVIVQLRDVLFGHKIPTIWPEMKAQLDPVLMDRKQSIDMKIFLYGPPDWREREIANTMVNNSEPLTPKERKDFELVMESRNAFLNQQCGRYAHLGNFSWTFSKEVYFQVNDTKILYCPIHKASSTKWYQNFIILWYNLTGNKLKKDKLGWEEWHQRIFRVARNFSSQTEIDQAINIENPLKFLIVRHPFHRLVSAYQNKLSFYHFWYYENYGNKIIAKYQSQLDPQSKDYPKDNRGRRLMTFWEFVQWFLDTSPHDMDTHWQPLYTCCSICLRGYDVVLKYESLLVETQQFLKYLNLQNQIPPSQWNSPKHSNEENDQLVKEHFNLLSTEEVLKVYKVYELDFKLFDYTFIYKNLTVS